MLECLAGGAFGRSQLVRWAAPDGGVCVLLPSGALPPGARSQQHRALDPRAPCRQSPRSCTPPGTGRSREGTGQRGLSCQQVPCKLCRSGHCTLRACVSYCRKLTPELEFWPPPLLFSSCLGGKHCQGTEVSQGKQLPLSPAPGRGWGSSSRCTHLRISTAGISPR